MREDEVAKLFQKYRPEMLGLAWRRLEDRQEAEDVVQEVFCELLHYNEPIKQPRAFLLRAVRNRCVDIIRQRTARPNLLGDLDGELPDTHEPNYGAYERMESEPFNAILDSDYGDRLSGEYLPTEDDYSERGLEPYSDAQYHGR